jgi:fumarate hydratase subunit beta
MIYRLNTADIRSRAADFAAGDRILLSGIVYTARDAAHKRMSAALDSGLPLPFDIKDAVIYYAGPTPTKNGLAVGSCGPTTSSRMDIYTPRLLDLGLACIIGKGGRGKEVTEAIVRNGAIYLCAIGGAGALACECITAADVIAYADLGCESVKRLIFNDFPLFVGIDVRGRSIYENKIIE